MPVNTLTGERLLDRHELVSASSTPRRCASCRCRNASRALPSCKHIQFCYILLHSSVKVEWPPSSWHPLSLATARTAAWPLRDLGLCVNKQKRMLARLGHTQEHPGQFRGTSEGCASLARHPRTCPLSNFTLHKQHRWNRYLICGLRLELKLSALVVEGLNETLWFFRLRPSTSNCLTEYGLRACIEITLLTIHHKRLGRLALATVSEDILSGLSTICPQI